MGKVVRMQERKDMQFTPAHEIRDFKGGGFFQVDDGFFDGYAAGVGTSATLVYMALCRYAGGDQTCFPGIELISEKLGISTRTVMRGIGELERRGIIKVGRLQGSPNLYTLMSKRIWGRHLAVEDAVPENIFSGFIGMCGECGNKEDGCIGCTGGTHWIALTDLFGAEGYAV